jgi:drug/metabolite transporter (DMT)-like permease
MEISAAKARLNPRVLLAILVLTWAISWPAIKIGVTTVPPIWYACFRYGVAAFCVFAFAVMSRSISLPPRADWPLVAVSGVFQMAVYSALTGLALTVLPPGRASVLAFSTPIWVIPLAAWRLREYPSRSVLLGAGLGIAGILTIAAPSFHPDGGRQMIAYGMLLGAAAAWAMSIVLVRAHRFTATALALAPWQMLVAACLLLPIAIIVEGVPPPLGTSAMASLFFVGPVATAFAYWAMVEAGRHLPAGAISTALLATPALGISISAVALGEMVGPSLIGGVAMIAIGIRLAAHRADVGKSRSIEPQESRKAKSPTKRPSAVEAEKLT